MNNEYLIIGLVSDFASYDLMQKVKIGLINLGFLVKDFGVSGHEKLEFIDCVHELSSEINNGVLKKGISFSVSGNELAIVANKYQYVRAAMCWNTELSGLARAHNDANICSIPSKFVDVNLAMLIIKQFLEVPFEGGRHTSRVMKTSILI